jgi:PKD repeat protein
MTGKARAILSLLAMCIGFADADTGSSVVIDWYVDAANGSDSNDGSYTAPYRTITNLWPQLEAGDTVGLFGGNYGGFDYYTSYVGNSPPDIFTNWVTFKAIDSENPPVFDYVHMGLGIGNVPLVPAVTGPPTAQANAYLAFEGLEIQDGVYIERLANVRFKGCRITLQLAAGFVNIDPDFPDADYLAEIERYAVEYNRAEHFYLEQCEVTESAHGVGGSGVNINIVSNEIHHLRHDGVRVWGCWNSRIEGNRIHNTDPLLTDAEAHVLYPDVNAARHADNIHVAISGSGPINTNVVIRNNIIYDTAGQSIQFNEYGSLRNENFMIEGNIFGPSAASLLNYQGRGLIFRNNTVCVLPEPRILNEGTRTHAIIVGTNVIRQAGTQNNIVMNNYVMRIASIASGVELYNNILGSYATDQGAVIEFSDYNVLQIEPSTPPLGVDISRALGRFTAVNTNSPLLNPVAFDGVLLSNAVQVINLGTHSQGQIDFADVAGTSRDNRPDLGAREMPGLSPAEEPVPQVIDDLKTVFLDDFEDGHYNDIDPWLNGTNTQGMSWYRPAEFTNAWDKFLVTHADSMLDRNALFMPNSPYARSSWMISKQGTNWSDYTFEFDCANAYVVSNCGATVLTLDQDNAYWLDISRDSGRLIRMMDGVETVLAASSAIEMPHSGTKHYKIDVDVSSSGITFDVATNGVPVFSFTDTNSAALAMFTAGGVGFHYDLPEGNFRMHFDNVRVELRPEGYEAPPIASFSADPASGGIPLSVTFTDASTRTITNRYWDFGDGAVTNTTATTLTHTYTSTGTYSVALVVSGPGGTDTASTQIVALCASVADVITVTAHADDRQWGGSSATNATGANASQATARTGSETVPGTYSYVIPFQLPVLPDGRSITNVSLSAFLTAGYVNNGSGAYVDVFAGRTAATSVTVAADWDCGAMTRVGDNIARIFKNAETNNTLKTVALTAAFFQNIYNTDPNAAGKYIFLTVAPEVAPAGSSQYIEWATANNTAVTNIPVLRFFLASAVEPVGPHAPPPAPTASLGSSGSFGNGQDVLSWTTVQGSGYVYGVWYSTNLLNGFQPLETGLSDTVTRITNTITASPVFYKIEAQ